MELNFDFDAIADEMGITEKAARLRWTELYKQKMMPDVKADTNSEKEKQVEEETAAAKTKHMEIEAVDCEEKHEN